MQFHASQIQFSVGWHLFVPLPHRFQPHTLSASNDLDIFIGIFYSINLTTLKNIPMNPNNLPFCNSFVAI